MLAMMRTSPPHLLHVSMSMLKTRFSLCAQVIDARRSEELASIENGAWQDQAHELSPGRATEIAEQLAARPQAMALTPSIVQHHVFNKRVIEQTRNSALEIIEQIELGMAHY
jgi:hypothetical protein